MALSPLVQLLIVAALAYGAGLLLGLSFYRGEIGPGRRRKPEPPASPGPAPYSAPPQAGDHKRRRRRKFRQFQEQLGEHIRQGLVLLFILAIITMLCLGIYGVMRTGADVLTSPRERFAQSAPTSPSGILV